MNVAIYLDKKRWKSVEHFLATGRSQMMRAMNEACALLHKQVVINLSGPSHTLFPGNGNPFPGVLHGPLHQNINREVEAGSDFIQGQVGPGPSVPYGRAHELGIGVPKRSFLRPALKKQLAAIMRIFRKALKASLSSK